MSYCKNLLRLDPRMHVLNRMRTIGITGVLIASASWASPAAAKFDDYLSQRWFTIELIVFERSNIDDTNTLEALAHPRPQADAAGESATEKPENLALTEPVQAAEAQDPLSQPAAIVSEQRRALELVDEAEDPAITQLRQELAAALDAYELELMQRNLIFEADANPVLEEELARLSRRRNHNILWRGHWLQAVPSREQPQPLTVAVNELENGEMQLSGSLEVTVNRYLHLKAQLWYHDPSFGVEDMDQAQARYPSPPPASFTQQQSSLGSPIAAGNDTLQQPLQQPLEPLGPEPLFMLLEETRRMRSGFLHYLDHPKLGLLVRIDKVKPPEALLAQYKAFEASQK